VRPGLEAGDLFGEVVRLPGSGVAGTGRTLQSDMACCAAQGKEKVTVAEEMCGRGRPHDSRQGCRRYNGSVQNGSFAHRA